jgi:hypothetical protein
VEGPDHVILEFLAGQPLLLSSQIRTLSGREDAGLSERLDGMEGAGLICAAPRMRHQSAYQITVRGLAAIESELPVPRVDLRSYWHDIGVAWLTVAVRRGMFGAVERTYSRREMLQADRRAAAQLPAIDAEWSEAVRAKAADALFGFSVGEGSGRPPLLYPDLVLVLPEGRVAMEFFWEAPSDRMLDRILDAFARKLTVVAMVFLCVDSAVGEQLRAAIAAHGLEDRARVEVTTLGTDAT